MAQSSGLTAQFGVPPYTNETEQPDNNAGLITTPQRGVPQPITGVTTFMQTDVIYAWIHYAAFTATITQSTDTVTTSPYYPYSYIGAYLLNMQQQFPAIQVDQLYDLIQVTNMRPFYKEKRGDFSYTNNVFVSSVGPATNPFAVPAANVTGTQQTFTLPIWLPASVYFDAYWEMSYDGVPISGPHNGYVSPQDMAGYARVVTPSVKFNPVFGATLDQAPFNDSGTIATGVVSVTSNFYRVGVLGNTDPATLPGPTNWQYNIASQQISLAGRSTVNVPLNSVFMGQIMSVTVRLFDPSANTGKGAAITDSTVTLFKLQFGGNGIRFQGDYTAVQRRFYDQHQFLPPDGVLQLDLAIDKQGWISNAYLLNTLREAGVTLTLNFSSTLSSTAYAQVTVEGLRFVPLTPVAQA